MKNFLSPLKLKGYLTLIGLVIIGFGWLLIDQIFLPEVYQRVIAFFILMFVLYYLQFAINKPDKCDVLCKFHCNIYSFLYYYC
jgi:apolipoprotein N-acyltransferase